MNDQRVMSALATALAVRADRVLPNGFHAQATGLTVSLSSVAEGHLRDIDLSLALQQADQLVWAIEVGALRVLSDFQDDVIESLRRAWPTAEGHAAPADAFAEVSHGSLLLGYRYVDSPVVDLQPIDLAVLDQ
jgi:hypothetical protein